MAEVAHMESAAVIAFAELQRELSAHGAPRELLSRVAHARADEIRHAAIMESQARRLGAKVPPVSLADGRTANGATRPLLAIAIDNAVEGCVRETYAALVALYQARHARDPELRAAFASVAKDEIRHAELSHEIADWLDERLDRAERAIVARERRLALDALTRECAAIDTAPSVARECGMPDAEAAAALLRELTTRLPIAA